MYSDAHDDNDLYYTCGMIEFIGRATKNKRKDIVNTIGKEGMYRLYALACVNHCLSQEQVCYEYIEEFGIIEGNYDNIVDCDVTIPKVYSIAKIYMRLILHTLDEFKANLEENSTEEKEYKNKVIDKLFEVYNSFIVDYIDNYNNLVFTGSPQFHYESHLAREILD